MAQQASFIDEGIDQVKEAWSNVGGEFEKVQKNLEKRRKQFEKEAEKRVKRFEKSPLGKRIVSFREDAQKQIESNIENLLGLIPIASTNEVKRLERKIATLTRKVNAIEKAQASKTASTSPSAGKTEAQASA
jgi:hypothetical protein